MISPTGRTPIGSIFSSIRVRDDVHYLNFSKTTLATFSFLSLFQWRASKMTAIKLKRAVMPRARMTTSFTMLVLLEESKVDNKKA